MPSIAVKNKAPLEQLISVRGSVFVLGKMFVIAAAAFAVDMGFRLKDAGEQVLPEGFIEAADDAGPREYKRPLSAYRQISARNIFGQSGQAKRQSSQPVSKLGLRLVGVNISPGNEFAIVENSKTKKQDVFSLQESIFDQATLVGILPESVRINRSGTIETLVLEHGSSAVTDTREGISSSDETDFVIDEAEVTEALANLPRLLSQARAVPYFRNGKSIGMRLFAIRKGSMYERIGLKNGDIIRSVNDGSLSDPTQALKLFEQLKSERSINVELERKGVSKELNYTIR